jgi:hypothetical protein
MSNSARKGYSTMKEYVIQAVAVCLAGGLGASVLAQGTVLFNNGRGGLVQVGYVNQHEPADDFHVELVYAPAGTPASPFMGFLQSIQMWVDANPGWTLGPTCDSSTNGLGPGLFDAGEVSLPGIAPGARASYAFFGWQGGWLNPTDYVGDYYRGLSSVFTTATGSDAASAVPLADTFGGVLLPVYSVILPEPGTLSLGVLGVCVMLSARRRRVRSSREMLFVPPTPSGSALDLSGFPDVQ